MVMVTVEHVELFVLCEQWFVSMVKVVLGGLGRGIKWSPNRTELWVSLLSIGIQDWMGLIMSEGKISGPSQHRSWVLPGSFISAKC